MLQPTKVGCLWEADRACGASEQDFKVLQQFRMCPLETAPPEDEQTPKNSKRHQRDQQSEWPALAWAGGLVGCEGLGAQPVCLVASRRTEARPYGQRARLSERACPVPGPLSRQSWASCCRYCTGT